MYYAGTENRTPQRGRRIVLKIDYIIIMIIKGDLMMKLPTFEALPVLTMCMNRREVAFVLTMIFPSC
jgi:hypothetical protein